MLKGLICYFSNLAKELNVYKCALGHSKCHGNNSMIFPKTLSIDSFPHPIIWINGSATKCWLLSLPHDGISSLTRPYLDLSILLSRHTSIQLYFSDVSLPLRYLYLPCLQIISLGQWSANWGLPATYSSQAAACHSVDYWVCRPLV